MDLNPNILQSNLFIPGPWGNEKMCIQKKPCKKMKYNMRSDNLYFVHKTSYLT